MIHTFLLNYILSFFKSKKRSLDLILYSSILAIFRWLEYIIIWGGWGTRGFTPLQEVIKKYTQPCILKLVILSLNSNIIIIFRWHVFSIIMILPWCSHDMSFETFYNVSLDSISVLECKNCLQERTLLWRNEKFMLTKGWRATVS